MIDDQSITVTGAQIKRNEFHGCRGEARWHKSHNDLVCRHKMTKVITQNRNRSYTLAFKASVHACFKGKRDLHCTTGATLHYHKILNVDRQELGWKSNLCDSLSTACSTI